MDTRVNSFIGSKNFATNNFYVIGKALDGKKGGRHVGCFISDVLQFFPKAVQAEQIARAVASFNGLAADLFIFKDCGFPASSGEL
ncbi:MAG: hypothetical protein KDK65_05620 [Chlamydiia bacterium]|nr:hypothetical protein [Chlamydiia bacterium]